MYDDEHDHHHEGAVTTMLPATIGGGMAPSLREIVVNGRNCLIRADHIDHAQLVALAFPDASAPVASTSSMTVSFRGGPHAAPQGILAPAQRTPLANGETFIVTRTDKS